MAISRFGRSAEYQKFPIATLATPAQLSNIPPAVAYRHAATEQFNGAVVADAFPYAACIPIASRIQGMVLQSCHWHARRQF